MSETVTFLFTDLEGSTRLWEEHPGAMRDALARHDEILREAITSHGGHVVKTTGDGAHAAFTSAGDAVGAAVAAQLALGAEDWSAVDGLRVRMGVHTGPAEARDGDYYGTAVNRAARLMSAAHGGQVLVSLATEEHLRDSGSDAVELVELGEVRLRDLSRPERVYQVTVPGLEAEFPPLRSLDAFPSNLPVQTSSFVGRDDEVRAVAEALEGSRMVTLTGVGGVGKTRLAVQVAAEVLPAFPDGAWLCELAAARDADSMVQLVAATLGVQPREGSSFEGAVLDYLRTKHLLLVLDNCEHLLEPAGELTDRILRRCPDVRILATSREGLAVDGESVRPLRSLSLPLPGADADSALESAAVRLFADRAFAATSDFVMDASTTTTVAELCRRLDGVPLAIELAAARVAAMSPADIEARLDERFRLLTGGRRTAVERHQTLRATVDWSYSLLQETEQLVFARLGCFAGSFDVDAAQAVASGSGVEEWDVLDAVTSLVTKSMVVAERSADGIRYSMLETLRQYAREQLDGAGEADTWRRRHAEHYAHVAEELSDRLYGPAEIEARTHLRAELDNLRAAVDWALDARDVGDVALALRVIAALAPESAQDMTLGVAMWAVRAAEQAEHAPAVIRGPVLGAAAFQATFLGANDRAIELAREAVRDPIPPPCVGVSIPYVAWGLALTMRGDPHEAIDVLRDAHVQLAAGGFGPFVLCAVSATLANMAVPAGDLDLAREAAERALREARDSGSPQAHVNALFSYAAAIETDDPKEALAAFDECIAIVRAGAADVNFSTSMAAAGLLRVRAGDPTGWRGLDEAVRHAAERGYRPMVVGALDRVTRAVATTDRHEDTAVLSGITLAGPLGAINHFSVTPPNLTDARAALGEVAFERGAARGVAMEFDDAVAYSLALLAQVIHEAEVAS